MRKAKVKKLVWNSQRPDPYTGSPICETVHGSSVIPYKLWMHEGKWCCTGVLPRFSTIEEAKAAAQADYDRRIMSAITPSNPEEFEMTRELLKRSDALGAIGTLIESLEEGLMTDAGLSGSDRVGMRQQIKALTLAKNEIAALSTPKVEAHPDDQAVDRFAEAMKVKLANKRAEGRGGWDDPEQCSGAFLSQLLVEHVEKGDPLDVGNLAMMLHQRGERIADDRERYREARKKKLAPSLPLNGGSSTSAKREATKRAALLAPLSTPKVEAVKPVARWYAVNDSDWCWDSKAPPEGDGAPKFVMATSPQAAAERAVREWREEGDKFDGAHLAVAIVETVGFAAMDTNDAGKDIWVPFCSISGLTSPVPALTEETVERATIVFLRSTGVPRLDAQYQCGRYTAAMRDALRAAFHSRENGGE